MKTNIKDINPPHIAPKSHNATVRVWSTRAGFKRKPSYEKMKEYLEPYNVEMCPETVEDLREKARTGIIFKYDETLEKLSKKLRISKTTLQRDIEKRWLVPIVHPLKPAVMESKENYDRWKWNYYKTEQMPTKSAIESGYLLVEGRTYTSQVIKYITRLGIKTIISWYQSIEKTSHVEEKSCEPKFSLQQFIPFGKDNKVEYNIVAQVIPRLYGIAFRKNKANSNNLTSILEELGFIHLPNPKEGTWRITKMAIDEKYMYEFSKPVETIGKDGSTKTHNEYHKFFCPDGINKLEKVLESLGHKITIEGIVRLQEAVKTHKTLSNYNIDLESIKKQLEKEMGWDTDSSVDIEEPVQNLGEYIPYDTGLSRIQNSLQDTADCMDLEYTVLTKSIDTWIKERGWLERPQGSLGDGYVVTQTVKEEGYMIDEYIFKHGSGYYQIYFTQNGMKFVIDDFTRELTQLAMDKLHEEVECTPLSIRKVYGDRIKELIKENPHTLVSITIITDTSPIPYYGTMQDIPDRLLDKQLENVSVSMTGEVYVVTGKEKKQ